MSILPRMNPGSREKLLHTLMERVKSAVETNEELRWDSLLSRFRGFVNVATGRQYRGWVNTLMLALTSWEFQGDPRYLTFCQLRQLSKGKGSVRKGSRLTPVFRPILKETEKEACGEEEKSLQVIAWTMAYVANVRQTNLIELGLVPERWTEAANKDFQPITVVEDFIGRIDFQRETSDIPCYIPARDTVGMPPFESFHTAFSHAEALCHELIHWSGTKGRLGRHEGTGLTG